MLQHGQLLQRVAAGFVPDLTRPESDSNLPEVAALRRFFCGTVLSDAMLKTTRNSMSGPTAHCKQRVTALLFSRALILKLLPSSDSFGALPQPERRSKLNEMLPDVAATIAFAVRCWLLVNSKGEDMLNGGGRDLPLLITETDIRSGSKAISIAHAAVSPDDTILSHGPLHWRARQQLPQIFIHSRNKDASSSCSQTRSGPYTVQWKSAPPLSVKPGSILDLDSSSSSGAGGGSGASGSGSPGVVRINTTTGGGAFHNVPWPRPPEVHTRAAVWRFASQCLRSWLVLALMDSGTKDDGRGLCDPTNAAAGAAGNSRGGAVCDRFRAADLGNFALRLVHEVVLVMRRLHAFRWLDTRPSGSGRESMPSDVQFDELLEEVGALVNGNPLYLKSDGTLSFAHPPGTARVAKGYSTTSFALTSSDEVQRLSERGHLCFSQDFEGTCLDAWKAERDKWKGTSSNTDVKERWSSFAFFDRQGVCRVFVQGAMPLLHSLAANPCAECSMDFGTVCSLLINNKILPLMRTFMISFCSYSPPCLGTSNELERAEYAADDALLDMFRLLDHAS
jgi:hypothetical protein